MENKLCVNCKHMMKTGGHYIPSVPYCRLHPEKIDPVDGQPTYIKCHDRRDTLGKCGPQGLLYEAKHLQKVRKVVKSWWKFWQKEQEIIVEILE